MVAEGYEREYSKSKEVEAINVLRLGLRNWHSINSIIFISKRVHSVSRRMDIDPTS